MDTDKNKVKVQIREATLTDLPQLCGLLGLLFAQEADFKPDAERQARGLSMIIEKTEIGRIYCAVLESSIVGMVSILYTVSTAEGGRAAWMEDMVVHPDWRGHRIGEP
jgi:N-acetylglutamate synthase-like GNAT family acetyltransferase